MSTATVARIGIIVSLGACATACASSKSSSPAVEAKSPSQQAYGQQPGPHASGGPQADASASPPPPPSTAPAQPAGGSAAGMSSRAIALQSASSEMETSQRELDVAAGDCRNACRALGSMDRAAGKVCELSHGDDDGRRCEDAKKRVYSSRDRVKTTCGECPGGPSVERSAPVPSR